MTRQPLGLIGLAVGSIIAMVLALGAWGVLGPGPSARAGDRTVVVLPAGGGIRGVARHLAEAGVIRSRIGFLAVAFATGTGHGLKAGEYALPSRASVSTILSILRRGAVLRHYVTIPEGFTSAAAVDVLRRDPILMGEVATPPEGAILPETYEVRRGESRARVLARMTAARAKLLDRLWRDRAPGLPYRNPGEAVTLASVVEKETALPDERPHIAALFVNRLRKGMRLESDPTVIYAVSQGAPLGRGLKASELASPSPYNTYRVGGLPPTPIANPGREALVAALNPPPTPDLFFVADGTGGHVFASTFEAHKRNVARWRAIERAGAGQGRS